MTFLEPVPVGPLVMTYTAQATGILFPGGSPQNIVRRVFVPSEAVSPTCPLMTLPVCAVLGVIGASAENEMVRIHASRSITNVTDEYPAGDLAFEQLVSHSMSLMGLPGNHDIAVSIGVLRSSPQPAGGCHIDLLQEAVRQ